MFNASKFNDYSILDEYSVGSQYAGPITIKKQLVFLDNGFYSYLVEDNQKNEFKISGNGITPLGLNKPYDIKGVISVYRGHNQVKINKLKPLRPKNKEGVILYLKTLKGLNKKAEVIYNEFGNDSIDYILKKPEVVAEKIIGVGIRSVYKWQKQLVDTMSSQDTISRLLEIGLSQKESKKLYDEFKDEIVIKIENNPYWLIQAVKGYGFEKADKIARELEIKPDSEYRIEEGIIHTLKNAGYQGHCYLPIDELILDVKELLSIKLSYIEMIKFKKEFSGFKSFEYYIGEGNRYDVDYKEMCYVLDSYENEPSKYKKNQYRYEVFNIETVNIEKIIDKLKEGNRVVVEEEKIYIRKVYESEVKLANNIKKILNYNNKYSRNLVEKVLDNLCKEKNIQLEEKQREACIEFNLSTNGMYVLTGGAGTGKTFCLLIILELSRRLNNNKPLLEEIMAPTGRASKVAAESTGMDCKTIHRGLGYSGGEFEYNEENLMDNDILIIDETSMLDLNLADKLISAIKSDTKIILLGDINQLPSVGAGNVLKDIINSNKVKIIMLNVLKRQDALSGIAVMADDINNDKMIRSCESTKDAYFIGRETPKGIQAAIISSINKILKFDGYTFEDIQVLVPQRTGSLGTYILNYLIQYNFNKINEDDITILAKKFKAKLNEDSENKEYSLYFKKGDKVINIKNSYDMEHWQLKDGDFIKCEKEIGVMNGETGVIHDINIIKNIEGKITKKEIMVKYDGYYIRYEDDFENLEHSYALTIHKSQGSAWKSIILCISNSAFTLLNNNLIYTGVTRARNFVAVIGQERAVRYGIKNHEVLERYTYLNKRIQED